MGFGGGFLRLFSTFLYFLEFCCAAVGLGIYAYFLAKLDFNDAPIDQKWRAVTGLFGSAALYTIFAVLLTCFLGGVRVFGFIAVVLNILFCGAMIAVAVLTRDGADSCSGRVETPLGNGPSNFEAFGDVRLRTACRLNTAAFAVSLIAAFLFLLSAIFQVFIVKHHRKEKKYGPSPANGYTSGSGKRKFWQRKPKTTQDAYGYENGAAPMATTNNRHSYDTAQTGLTGHTDNSTKYEPTYHSGPTGTAVNGAPNNYRV